MSDYQHKNQIRNSVFSFHDCVEIKSFGHLQIPQGFNEPIATALLTGNVESPLL